MADHEDIHAHLRQVVAPAANLAEGAQLLDEDTVRRQVRHMNGRTREVLPRVEGADLAALVALGFEPDLTDTGTDPLLAPMFLPQGWQRRTGEPSIYSYLVDASGTDRVLVMYKGAAHDRDAWMRPL